MKPTITEFTIDRSKWKTGRFSGPEYNTFDAITTGLGYTSLKNKEGFYCCLGFFAEACGVTNFNIKGSKINMSAVSPADLETPIDEPVVGFYTNAMGINDDPKTSMEYKEQAVKDLFKQVGIDVNFVGEYEVVTIGNVANVER